MNGTPFLGLIFLVLFVAAPLTGAQTVYRLAKVDFIVDGRSREAALLQVAGLREGREYASLVDLETALESGRQALLNRRVFDDVDVTYAVREGDGAVRDVEARFLVDDGWTLIAVPFYRYDSNSGHNPLAIMYWDNIAGTLTNFQLSAGYSSRDWVTPFEWDVNLRWSNIRFWNREWDFATRQRFTTTEKADPMGDLELAYSGVASQVSLSSSLRVSERLRYSFAPEFSATYGYDTIENTIDADIPDDRLDLGYAHSLGYSDVDWLETFRTGYRWSVRNGIGVDPRDLDIDADLSLKGTRFWYAEIPALIGGGTIPFNPGITGTVTHSFDGDVYGRGSSVRGVEDNRVFGQTGIVIQSEIAFRLADIRRFGEFHISPFFDAALFRKEDSSIDGDDFSAGVGFDLTFFPDFIRGFQGRASLGFDLRDPGSMEFFIIETLEF